MINRIKHVGLIMDGNRRYAKNHSIPIKYAHTIGAANFIDYIKLFSNNELLIKIPELSQLLEVTFYALTLDNLNKRSSDEVNALKSTLVSILELLNTIVEKSDWNNKVRFIGEYNDTIEKDTVEKMINIENKCKSKKGITFNIAICYDWKIEVENASYEMIKNNGNDISQFLPIKTQMDLVIRTGGVVRTSGFFPLNTVYSEWVFLESMWPEFDTEEFINVVKRYNPNTRRFGS